MAGLRVNTFNVTSVNSPYLVEASMNIQRLSYKMSNGASDAGTFTGNATIKNAAGTDQASQAVALGPGEGDTFISGSPEQPIDGLSFSVTTGTLRFIIAQ